MTWTDTKIEIITQMWSEGYSGTIIGQRAGKTRCAVSPNQGRMA